MLPIRTRRLENLDFVDDLAQQSHQIKYIREKLLKIQTRKRDSVTIGGGKWKE